MRKGPSYARARFEVVRLPSMGCERSGVSIATHLDAVIDAHTNDNCMIVACNLIVIKS